MEPVHGSAPDIAGEKVQSQTACSILEASAIMLRMTLNRAEDADLLDESRGLCLPGSGARTADIAEPGARGKLSTGEMGDAVLDAPPGQRSPAMDEGARVMHTYRGGSGIDDYRRRMLLQPWPP